MSARQSRPGASATARSSTTFAGSWTASGVCHPPTAVLSTRSRPPLAPDRLHQRDATGLRHHPTARRVDRDTRVQPATQAVVPAYEQRLL